MRRAVPALPLAFAHALVLVSATLFTSACTPSQHPRGNAEYFPLGAGHYWVYRVTRPELEPTKLEFRIEKETSGDRGEQRYHLDESGNRFYLRHGETIAYSVSPDIWTVFLDGPLVRGGRFDGARASYEGFNVVGEPTPTAAPDATPVPMRKVASAGYKLVTATNRRVTVPAGKFADCLEVTHVSHPTIGVKYFAPGIGMVFAEAWMEDPTTGKRTLVTRQELVEYHIAGRTGGDASAAFPALASTTAGQPAAKDSSQP